MPPKHTWNKGDTKKLSIALFQQNLQPAQIWKDLFPDLDLKQAQGKCTSMKNQRRHWEELEVVESQSEKASDKIRLPNDYQGM